MRGPARAVLVFLTLTALPGCTEGGIKGFDLEGGIHDWLDHGINVTLYSAPMEQVLPVRPVMPYTKIGPPQW